MRYLPTLVAFALIVLPAVVRAQSKPPITLDEFMNAVDVRSGHLSPDGSAAVISTDAADWQHDRFNDDLWLWTRQTNTVVPLTHSGHDSAPQWSPDGKTVAFISDRPLASGNSDDEKGGDASDKDDPSRIWLIPVTGGEAFPLYREKLDAHAFGWSADGLSIVFSATDPLSKDAEGTRKEEWKDVIRWREQERGDVLLSLPISSAIKASRELPQAHQEAKPADDKPQYPADAVVIARSLLEITTVLPSPAGEQIAFETGPISHRLENPADSELFLVAAKGGAVRRLTHNEGLEDHLVWNPSGKSIDLLVAAASGSIEGPYTDVQGRLYSLDIESAKVTRLGGDFDGSWEDFTLTQDGTMLAAGLKGVNQQIYRVDGPKFHSIASVPGNYAHLDAARHSAALLFIHSAIIEPSEVYIANGLAKLNDAKPVTTFNHVFGERAQVDWAPYKWKSDDGTEVEGVLIYPPGKKGEKNLRMLTFIHGGPADADGNRFGADWYDYATLAATRGWLVFRPNYRGSSGYGDAFILGIMPHLVSVPGRDILSGVDALVKSGIADPNHLTIGGYSYGGYMTNWLITQTTRFKAAVTGAGAVEHVANWGNDDDSWDDAWYLSGTPWEKPDLYQSEAALFQINKVTTPTHIVGGNADVRVSYLEQVLLERALQRLNVPHALLVFPGENHPLDKNPWHGYIKVREELNWLDKYGASDVVK
jgi:dipeptidyl aminopeptidase/acylaminoacyl peptidase